MFEKTLIPVAYGESPEELRKVGRILVKLGAQSICLFHVSEGGSFFRGSDLSWLMLLKETLEDTGLAVEVKLGNDHVASAIAEAALLEGVDEIYMKTKRRWHIETVFLGSVSRDLLRLTDVPVFVHKIRPRLPGEEGKLNREDLVVLYATDLDEVSYRPLPYVREIKGGWCHVLHVRGWMADPAAELRREKKVASELDSLREELSPYYRRVTTEQKKGDPATEVLQVSSRINADIIVIGKKQKSSFFPNLLGRTAERIVASSNASIFLVP
ncbi:MAG: universal stress protein [Methanomicrobiaceae archaeon]|nr:universal stress protein [Methanomicrobiaceae archaeon]